MSNKDDQEMTEALQRLLASGQLAKASETLDAFYDLLDTVDTTGGAQTERQLAAINAIIKDMRMEVRTERGQVVVYVNGFRFPHAR